MTQIKNPIVRDGAGRCKRAKIPAYILSTSCNISTPTFIFLGRCYDITH
jgi:hypothetical protein